MLVALACAIAVCAGPAATTYAQAAESSVPEYFTVYVGYSGGPFYAKKLYTNDQLWALSDNNIYEFCTVDAAHALRKGFGQGVVLNTLMADAGVQTSIERYYFVTGDNYAGNDDGALAVGDPWGYDELIAKTRYYYPDFPSHWSYNLHQIIDIDQLEVTKVQVPTILALKSSFLRITSAEEADLLWNDSKRMNTNAGYRLMFGAESANQSSARSFASMVTGITCIMPGYLEVTFSNNVISGEVGDVVDLTPNISSSTGELDPTIAAEAAKDVKYTISNSDVAEVFQKEDGSWAVRIKAEGEFSLSYDYSTSKYNSYHQGSTGTLSGKGTGKGTNKDSDDDGSGAGKEGEGRGSGAAGGTGGGTGSGDGTGNSGGNSFNGGDSVGQVNNAGGGVAGDEGASGADGADGEERAEDEVRTDEAAPAPAATLVAYELKIVDDPTGDANTDIDPRPIIASLVVLLLGGVAFAFVRWFFARDEKVRVRQRDVGGRPELIEALT